MGSTSGCRLMARRTKAEICHVKLCAYQLWREMQPMTDRQLICQLTTIGVINKMEAKYKHMVCRHRKYARCW